MKRIALLALGAACSLSEPPDTGTTAGAVDVTWMNAVGVATAGNSLTKTGATGWNAGAASVETIPSEGYVEFTTGENTTAKMAGLSVGDAGQHHADIDFAFYLKASGGLGVYEGGVQKVANVGLYAAGDVFRIENEGGVVTYWQNGVLVHTSEVAPGSPLGVDTSLNTPGGTVSDVQLVSTELSWQNLVGVAAAGNDLTKTSASTGWNAGASSVDTLDGSGFVEFRVDENDTAKMAGLGNGDSSQHFADIEYAVWLKANGNFGVYEGGVLRNANLGTYGAGDVFRITVAGGVVGYKRNGDTFYTSSVAASFPLRLDTSLHTPGATISDARLVTGFPACQGPFSIGPGNQSAVAECTVINGNLTLVGSVDLPTLIVVRGNIFAEADAVSISMPALTSAYSFRAGRKRTWMVSLDLSSLQFLGGGGGSVRGDFLLSNPKDLVALSLPSLESMEGTFSVFGRNLNHDIQTIEAPLLESIGGDLSINRLETLTSLDFSSLSALGGGLTISWNVSLPNCQATAIEDQLLANGWPGPGAIEGNGTGSCQ